MRAKLMLAVLAFALLFPAPTVPAPAMGNGVVKASTDTETWTSAPTTIDDVNTKFTVAGTTITLDAPTTDIVSDLDPPGCSVVVNQDGQLQATLQCTVPGQKVYYFAPAWKVQPTGAGNAFVLGDLLGGYAEVFLAAHNDRVTFTNVYRERGAAEPLHNLTETKDLIAHQSQFKDTPDPLAVLCPITIDFRFQIRTPDGWSFTHDASDGC